jgi:hypothetical protein
MIVFGLLDIVDYYNLERGENKSLHRPCNVANIYLTCLKIDGNIMEFYPEILGGLVEGSMCALGYNP